MESILVSIKKLLMISEEYTFYDVDIILHINSVFSTLFQLGVGPQNKQFRIKDEKALWKDFTRNEETIEMVKTYMGLRLKLIFDPPDTGFVTNAYQDMIKEFEWRLNVAVDPKNNKTDDTGDIDILEVLYKNAVENGYTGTKEDWLAVFNGKIAGELEVKDFTREEIDDIVES